MYAHCKKKDRRENKRKRKESNTQKNKRKKNEMIQMTSLEKPLIAYWQTFLWTILSELEFIQTYSVQFSQSVLSAILFIY